jgi:hypothetical protein
MSDTFLSRKNVKNGFSFSYPDSQAEVWVMGQEDFQSLFPGHYNVQAASLVFITEGDKHVRDEQAQKFTDALQTMPHADKARLVQNDEDGTISILSSQMKDTLIEVVSHSKDLDSPFEPYYTDLAALYCVSVRTLEDAPMVQKKQDNVFHQLKRLLF